MGTSCPGTSTFWVGRAGSSRTLLRQETSQQPMEGFSPSSLLLFALVRVTSFIAAFVFLLSPKLEVSRVSKREVFALFQQLCAKSNRRDLQSLSVYSDAKEAAGAYQEAKQSFFSTLEELGYGSWIRKPQEEDNFSFPGA